MIRLKKTESLQTGRKTGWGRFIVGRSPAWTFARVLLLIFGSFSFFNFVLIPLRVTGESMEPTFHEGQLRFLNVLAYKWDQPKRGDIIGFSVGDNRQIIIKRIIGLPGERIAFQSSVVLINGKSIIEPYLTSPGSWEWPEEKLSDDVFFVAGDNRAISEQFLVERGRILGRIKRFSR